MWLQCPNMAEVELRSGRCIKPLPSRLSVDESAPLPTKPLFALGFGPGLARLADGWYSVPWRTAKARISAFRFA
jgi:hypothetical protein